MTIFPTPSPCDDNTTAAILAGGRGQRMHGEDKGWIMLNGKPLVEHVLERLQKQVTHIMISANRNQASYQALGFPLVTDEHSEYPGPLAGIYSALQHNDREWLLTVPCDTPLFPDNLMEKLADAIRGTDRLIAVAHDGDFMQPVFCLLHRSLAASLKQFLDSGGHKTSQWIRQQPHIEVIFPADRQQFSNINTPEQLQEMAALLNQAG